MLKLDLTVVMAITALLPAVLLGPIITVIKVIVVASDSLFFSEAAVRRPGTIVPPPIIVLPTTLTVPIPPVGRFDRTAVCAPITDAADSSLDQVV